MPVVKNRKIFYVISAVLFSASVIMLAVWGLNLGIDFKGGSIMELKYASERPSVSELMDTLSALDIGGLSIREASTDSYIIRSAPLDDAKHEEVSMAVSTASDGESIQVEETRFSAIGPLLGREAAIKSLWAIGFVLLAIVLFIAFAFRKVSEPVASWKYGLIAVIALIHDITIPAGVFAVLGQFYGVEIDTLFVTAILVVLGFSVHDTIVVFDRVRENLRHEYGRKGSEFSAIVGKSIGQTFVRSINTSLSTLLAMVVLYFIGPASTQYFSLVLIIGITAGTYSSIFIASPLLVTVEKWQRNRGKN